MFTSANQDFVAEQATSRPADYQLATGAADRFLTELGVTFHALPYYFRVDPATLRELTDATATLVEAQQKLFAAVCANRSPEQLAELLQVPPAMAGLIDWPALASSRFRMLRADIIPTEAGYHFCEINHFSAVGGGEGYHSAKVIAELLGRSVPGVSPFRDLAYHYITECRRSGFVRIVILDSAEHRKQGFGEHRMLQDYLRLMAPDLQVSYQDDQTYPAVWLEPDEASRTLIHRLITLGDTTDSGAFLVRLRELGATLSCGFEAELKMHRIWFSMLCDPDYRSLFDQRELAVIDTYVPYTFQLGEHNLASALADKDDYIFKTSYSYGGKGVLLGSEHSREELRDALLVPGIRAWTGQQVVPTSSLELPTPDGGSARFYFVLGMFGYGENYSGLLIRGAVGSSVVNVSRGGGVSWAFVE
ncbi:MAG TPA: hypothetical protein VFD94_07720 [Jatrophihabitans sp.]|jgi:hypothetical protein|nr:hypothetical protein [Jatrophihabitans sp.]